MWANSDYSNSCTYGNCVRAGCGPSVMGSSWKPYGTCTCQGAGCSTNAQNYRDRASGLPSNSRVNTWGGYNTSR